MTNERGFTLLEVVIALAIIAIALATATRATAVAGDSSYRIKQHILANWVAQNRLAERLAQRDQAVDIGVNTGSAEQAGLVFTWQETVTTTDNPAFRRLEVKVFSPGDENHAAAQLIGYLAQTQAPE
jgi:general secretion pathway protein I